MKKTIKWPLESTYTTLSKELFTPGHPTPVSDPRMVAVNEELAAQIGLSAEELVSDDFLQIFAGNNVPDGAVPLAQAYAGHQFGHLNRLGDGRALLLGEYVTAEGERLDIQLKGSGPTPYSRGGDGRAALGPMIREYVISEAMHELGIPTNRALAIVTTGEPVYRETELEGAVLTRVAASHIRVGTFQFASAICSKEEFRTFADYTIKRHYPDIPFDQNRYKALLESVIKRQAALVAKWMHIGFIHGVMNTDNMTISGETIDYGPCAFMNTYDPATVFSSIDTQGRYAYGNQPQIAGWNLARFAESLLPILHDDENRSLEIAQEAMQAYGSLYEQAWLDGMRKKIGLITKEDGDRALINQLLELMHNEKTDFTDTFKALATGSLTAPIFQTEAFGKWQTRWHDRLQTQTATPDDVKELMRTSNPAIIPRNDQMERAIEAAVQHHNYQPMHDLLALCKKPYDYREEQLAVSGGEDDPYYRTYCGT